VLLGIIPFGVITGVAMVASGIPPLVAMLMSIVVFAGASMVASAQLLASLHDVQRIAAPLLRQGPARGIAGAK
jgi:predicted branched-subunit amino acid permease